MITANEPVIPAGTAGTVPSMDPDSPRWDAVRDAAGVVWVHWAGTSWTRLYSPSLAELFEPSAVTS